MRLLIGLGNPGEQHVRDRHTIGFVCLDAVAKKLGAGKAKQFKDGELWEIGSGTTKSLLFKPTQFMNTSGRPVREVVEYFGVAPEDICVIADDVYIAPGSVRVRKSGGDGGHNGLKSLLDHSGSDEFWRVKIGVGLYEQHPEHRVHQPPLDEYVLQPLPAHERKMVEQAIDRVVPKLVEWLEQGTLAEETIHP
ncbi:MAG: aminoacyl-tRNA hydrolase [bacterium]